MPVPWTTATALARLKRLGSPAHRASKARLGIPVEKTFGVTMGDIRALGKQIGPNQKLAEALWESGYHEARLVAVLVADPRQTTVRLAERWLGEVVSWDLCDHLCNNLLLHVPACVRRIPRWANDPHEFVRRAAFALIASVSIHHPEVEKKLVTQHLDLIRQAASDPRPYVKKAVSWALREIGKRDRDYGTLASATQLAKELAGSRDAAERWVGKDALKELGALTSVPGHKRLVPQRTKSRVR